MTSPEEVVVKSRTGASGWKRVLVVLLAFDLVAALFVGYGLYRITQVSMPEWYAAWEIGDLIVEHLETHEGKWPHGWEDLRAARNSRDSRFENAHWHFDQLPGIVKVNWDLTTDALAKVAIANGESSITVVTRLDGSKLEAAWGEDTEPNRKIARYLIKKYSGSGRNDAEQRPLKETAENR